MSKGLCDLQAARGIRLYYEIAGPNRKAWQGDKEELVLLIPGSAADLRRKADRQYINMLSQYLKVLAFDHRNTGQSDKRDEPVSMADYADDVAALIQELVPDQQPVHVIGVSFGGMVAQHLAIRHPALIKKLVLCCCSTGGAGGSSFPIHEWYGAEVTVAERVWMKMCQANSDRTERWREENKTMHQALTKMMTEDEAVGADDPMRDICLARQLAARQEHDTWDDIVKLQGMDVVCLGSNKDQITSPQLLQVMADRIGCQVKLDFDWGHPFLSADETASPWVNEWLRRGVSTWEIVGGADKGGIIVRRGLATTSPQCEERLSTGAIVQEMELSGERLQYKLLTGTGPATGWVSIKLKDKDLAVRTAKKT